MVGRKVAALVALLLVGSTLALASPAPSGAATLPVTGKAVPSLAAFDTAMTTFMGNHGINGGVLAVERNGKVLLERGYGWQDAAHTTALPPSALLRIASNSKIVTSHAIDVLVDQGLLQRADRVFCTPDQPTGCILSIDPPAGYTRDSRLGDITVQDLVDHKGGWDTAARGSDIAFETAQAATALGVPSPADKYQLARWVVGQPLYHDPGTTEVYANIGYVMLGLVIEQVTGKHYIDFVRQSVLASAGTTDMAVGHALPSLRDPREPNYEDPNTGPNLWNPSQTVALCDGEFSTEALDSAGGLISSSRAYVKFLESYLPGTGWGWTTFGSLPGTMSVAIVQPDGTHIFAALNAREEPDGTDIDQNTFSSALNSAEASITTWPTSEVDKVAPTTVAPSATVKDGVVPTTTAVSTLVSWSATDAQSGVDHYELQKSIDGAAFVAQPLFFPQQPSNAFNLAYGHSYRYRVRAVDRAGNVSAWATGQPITPKLVDDGATSVTYSTGWTKATPASALNATLHYSKTSAKTATYTFTGRGVTLVSTPRTDGGRVKIAIDGVTQKTVDLYSATIKPKTTVFSSGLLTNASHTIKLTVQPTANPASHGIRVDVDAFVVR
ncbi:MAG: serine hydrolase [Acidimicrobiia bacterium]|nr:serine hydrolase [Acidimicrobiia bacterium]